MRDRVDGKAGDEVFGFDSLTVNAELVSLAVAGIIVKEIELVGPRAKLVRLPTTVTTSPTSFQPPDEKSRRRLPACRAFGQQHPGPRWQAELR